jgi:hypothetical protein
VRLIARQKRQVRGAQQILRGMFDELGAAKALDESSSFCVGT